MKFGLCTSIREHETAQTAGFDYIEPPVANLVANEPDAEFGSVRETAASAGVKPEAFNCFIPGELKITGPDVHLEQLRRFVSTACGRASQVGAEVIVFGSGGARCVPEGFPLDQAMDQVAEFLEAIGPIAAGAGIRIAIEPLCKAECNIINLVREGCELAKRVNHPAVRCLADLYHIGQENEPYENIVAGRELLAHVHVAHPVTRKCPLPADGFDYKLFFSSLKRAGYDERISVECAWDDLPKQAPITVEYLKSEWEKA